MNAPTLDQLQFILNCASGKVTGDIWAKHQTTIDTVQAWLLDLKEMEANPFLTVNLARSVLAEQGEISEPVHKFLELSTRHIGSSTADLLRENAIDSGVICDEHRGYGWWVYVEMDDIAESDAALPADLRAAVQYARALGCLWIMFDEDAAPIDDLPEYDW